MKKYFLFLGIFFLIGCSGQTSVTPHLVNTGKPALHAIQSERLKILMRELDDLMFERMLNEVQIDRQRRYRTEQIVKVAEQLLNTVDFIPDALPELSLKKTEQQIFLNLSTRLKQQVSLLKHEAEENYVDAIPQRVEQIVETCNACHQVFRQNKMQ